jgi:hypothetical protein
LFELLNLAMGADVDWLYDATTSYNVLGAQQGRRKVHRSMHRCESWCGWYLFVLLRTCF